VASSTPPGGADIRSGVGYRERPCVGIVLDVARSYCWARADQGERGCWLSRSDS
jgi:hypothetical protein